MKFIWYPTKKLEIIILSNYFSGIRNLYFDIKGNKMKIEYVDTNIAHVPERYIAHGTNCMGVMGSGVAKILRGKYKDLFPEYKKLCDQYPDDITKKQLLGGIQFVECGDKVIFNCFTQMNFGTKVQHVDYNALRNCMKEIDNACAKKLDGYFNDSNRVAMPKIGAGLGGGDWEIISKIIEEESIHFQPVVSQYAK
jgi:O-acetyl-ADP-ribose deacetylase (regulator of RNase III)